MKKQIACIVVFLVVVANIWAAANGERTTIESSSTRPSSHSAENPSPGSRLLTAANEGSLSNVISALNARANINVRSERNTTPLMNASGNGHLEIVKYLVERGANLNLVDEDGNTALDRAIANNKPTVVEYLGNHMYTSLFFSAAVGNLAGVKFFVENGANINQRSGLFNGTPLMEAGYNGHLEVVKFLVEKGADITAADDDCDTVFYYARWGEHYPVIDYLRSQATSLLYKAAKNGDAYGVELAVENGANINYRDEDDNTPIVVAAIAGKYNVVELLAELGANVNARNKEGRSALNYVHDRGDMDIYDFLVAHDARTFTPNPTPAPAPVIVVQQPAPVVVTQVPAPAPAVVAQQPAPAQTPAPQNNIYVQPSNETNVYVQPSAPAAPAPAQTGSSSSSQTSGQQLAQAIGEAGRQVQQALRGSLDSGRYRMSGQRDEIYKTGMGSFGNISYTDANGKRSSGTWSISDDRFTINIDGVSYFYTITSQTTFSGHGEDWVRVGY
jgi:ankyrin repeat protein